MLVWTQACVFLWIPHGDYNVHSSLPFFLKQMEMKPQDCVFLPWSSLLLSCLNHTRNLVVICWMNWREKRLDMEYVQAMQQLLWLRANFSVDSLSGTFSWRQMHPGVLQGTRCKLSVKMSLTLWGSENAIEEVILKFQSTHF